MFYSDRINTSKEIDLTKINIGKECMDCHYWYFDHGFKFLFFFFFCNGCHVSTMLDLNISNIAIITVK